MSLLICLMILLLTGCQTTHTVISSSATEVRDDISLLQTSQTSELLLIEDIKKETESLTISLEKEEQKEIASLIQEHIILLEKENEEQRNITAQMTQDLSNYEDIIQQSEQEKLLLKVKIDKLTERNNQYKLLIIILTFLLILVILLITTTHLVKLW